MSPADRRRALGAAGEQAAANWYEAAGFSIVARNWRCDRGELDLVAGRHDLVAFCEVKTRTSATFGAPIEAVTERKARRVRMLAAQWLAQNPRRANVRFDVASVTVCADGSLSVEVSEDAF